MNVHRAPLIFQRDGSILITGGHGQSEALDVVRNVAVLSTAISDSFVFELSPVAMWGAAAGGWTPSELLARFNDLTTTGVPAPVAATIADIMGRYGVLSLEPAETGALLRASDPTVLDTFRLGGDRIDAATVLLTDREIGATLMAAAQAGWPVVDRRVSARSQRPEARVTASLRPYQRQALGSFERSGSGLILLPCGAGKTLIGVAAASSTSGRTLIVVPSRTVAEQWRESFLANTSFAASDISLDLRPTDSPVRIATYSGATVGKYSSSLLAQHWDLVIYDEVQSLPADMFRRAASFRATRRLGLTATLIREDGREREIAGLVGPLIYTVSWKELEREGWIAPARCIEVRLPWSDTPQTRQRYKLAALQRLMFRHQDEQVVVAGTSVASLRQAGRRLGFPVLTGASPEAERSTVYASLRDGDISVLGVSRIGAVGVDVPGASVLIQLSGTFGSRQEEAQRLGRVLRPQPGKVAHLYSLVAEGTREVEFAAKRRRFLVDQGYNYEIIRAADLPRPGDGAVVT